MDSVSLDGKPDPASDAKRDAKRDVPRSFSPRGPFDSGSLYSSGSNGSFEGRNSGRLRRNNPRPISMSIAWSALFWLQISRLLEQGNRRRQHLLGLIKPEVDLVHSAGVQTIPSQRPQVTPPARSHRPVPSRLNFAITALDAEFFECPHNLTAVLKTTPMPVRLELRHDQGLQLCQHGGDLSRSFVFWEARHQPLRRVGAIFAGRSWP